MYGKDKFLISAQGKLLFPPPFPPSLPSSPLPLSLYQAKQLINILSLAPSGPIFFSTGAGAGRASRKGGREGGREGGHDEKGRKVGWIATSVYTTQRLKGGEEIQWEKNFPRHIHIPSPPSLPPSLLQLTLRLSSSQLGVVRFMRTAFGSGGCRGWDGGDGGHEGGRKGRRREGGWEGKMH